MNSEMLQTLTGALGGLFSIIIGLIYSYSGRDGTSKAWRRFLCPTVLCGGLIDILAIEDMLTCESGVASVVSAITAMLGYVSGYGGNNVWLRIVKRTKIACLYILAIIPLCYVMGNYGVLAIHAPLCLLTIMFAFYNPLPAAKEEFIIGVLSVFIILQVV